MLYGIRAFLFPDVTTRGAAAYTRVTRYSISC